MISFDTYLSNCFEIGDFNLPQTFYRSDFDFGQRQRKGTKRYPTLNTKLTLSESELQTFFTFWTDINEGQDKFTTTQPLFGVSGLKTIRIIEQVKINELGNLFKVELKIEHII